MKAVLQPLAWGLAMASILAMATGVALGLATSSIQAAEPAHSHHGHSTASQILAPSGEKWPTDASLREGMTRIQDAVHKALPSTPTAPLTANQAAQLRETTDSAIVYMVDNCALEPEADAALHVLLAELIKGTDALSHAELREAGLEYIVSALQRYSEAFDQPLWR